MNREAWLTQAIEQLEFLFGAEDLKVPAVRISVGFPGGNAKKATTIGQCWASAMSVDKKPQIFIHPTLTDPIEILATIMHELVHAIDDCKSGHKGAFVKMVRALGLEGKPTATHAGEELKERLTPIVDALGEYPHAMLKRGSRGSETPKKQSTRMLKIECPNDGYTARTTRKWLDDLGAPTCPCGEKMEEK